MNIETILGLATALFGGLNIFQFIFLRVTKKEYEAKAEQAIQTAKGLSTENDAKAVDTLKKVIDELQEEREKLKHELSSRYNIIDILKEDRHIAALHMCLHMGCALRRPENGKGLRLLQQKRDDVDLDVDYLPINILLKQYGSEKEEKIERATKEKTFED